MLSGYVSKSACNGKRPSRYCANRGRQRPALIARLLKERGVARFIVAPSGYGKTHLAFEYAETVFGWRHVFLLNAKSPCFLRDLDAGTLVPACNETDADASLVVFDDLPILDAQRAQHLSEIIDVLLEAHVEVLVTCTPMCDTVSGLQVDCVKVGSYDILLDDDELDVVRLANERLTTPSRDIPLTQRVAALVWADEANPTSRFAADCFDDDMPADLMLAMFTILVLQHGSLSDVRKVAGYDHEDVFQLLKSYPHLGLDDDLDSFDSVAFPVSDIVSAVKPRISVMVESSACDNRNQLVEAVASMLVGKNRPKRACDFVKELYPREQRGEWLVLQAYNLVGGSCFAPCANMLHAARATRLATRGKLRALEALCLRMLGNAEQAALLAKPHAFDNAASYDVRVCCLLILARNASPSLSLRALNELKKLSVAPFQMDVPHFGLWKTLAQGLLSSDKGLREFEDFWQGAWLEGIDDAALCIMASWLLDALADAADGAGRFECEGRIEGALAAQEGALAAREGDVASECGQEVARYVRSRLVASDPDNLDFFTASAGLALERCCERGLQCANDTLPSSVLAGLRDVKLDILSQQNAYEQTQRATRIKRRDWETTHPDSLLGTPSTQVVSAEVRSVPTLDIRLFGRLSACIGGAPIAESLFNRRNVRVLLAMLALCRGRELARETIAHTMWPTSAPSVARKNFYTVWSQLRKALTLPDGTCPYLVRHQYSCSLEERYIRSDAARLNEICRELSFGTPDVRSWASLYYEIDRDFLNELLPAERKNEFIVQAREDFRARLIDSLIAASCSIAEVGDVQWATWFARAAVKRDKTREDAYIALMRAQHLAHQRTAAMATYLKCRKILSDELGVDPSPEVSEFYERLIEADVEVC